MTRLTLSFDNGPWPSATDAVLDVLKARGLPATFFVVGDRLADPIAARSVARAHDEGHWIGNHTMTHRQPLGWCDADDAVAEIEDAEEAIASWAHPAKFFRPPGKGRVGSHLLNRAAADHLVAHAYTAVTWNNVPRDWDDVDGAWIGRAMADLAERDWSLLVLHDHHLARMPGTLARFLDALKGVEIVQGFPPDCLLVDRGTPCPGLGQSITLQTGADR